MSALEPVTVTGRRGNRFAALWLLLAQCAAALVIPAADALLEAQTSSESVHVESGDVECATHHDALFCQTVRSLTIQAGASPPSVPATVRPLHIEAMLSRGSSAVRPAIPVGPVGPRAPPSV